METGGVTGRAGGAEASAITPENIARVEIFFTDNPKSHIREAAFELELSVTTVWRVLRLRLQWKPYKPLRVNMLSEKNMQDRVEFCHWFLDQGEDFAQRVIFSDNL